MKKLMIAAAAAALIGGAEAAIPGAQVYDVTMTIKTTKASKANVSKPWYWGNAGSGTVYYRAQTTRTWKGLIWGCDCCAIQGKWAVVSTDPIETVSGTVIWDTTSKDVVYLGNGVNGTVAVNDPANTEAQWDSIKDHELWNADNSVKDAQFGWQFLQAINKDGKSVEGLWTIAGFESQDTDDTADEKKDFAGYDSFYCGFNLTGAGFGTVANPSFNDCDETYVKSISGNLAGEIRPDCYNAEAGCVFCGKQKNCITGEAWNFCACCGFKDETWTAAYGTWTIAYNSSLSKKLADTASIVLAYNFKNLPKVSAKIALATAYLTGNNEPDQKAAQENYAAATNKLALAKAWANELEAYKTAEDEYDDANDEYKDARSTYRTAKRAYEAAEEAYKKDPTAQKQQAMDDAEDAMDDAEDDMNDAEEAKNDAKAAMTVAKAAAKAAVKAYNATDDEYDFDFDDDADGQVDAEEIAVEEALEDCEEAGLDGETCE